MARNNDPGFLTLDVVRRQGTEAEKFGAIEVVSFALTQSVRVQTELEVTNRPGGLTSTPSRIPGTMEATIRISSDVTVAETQDTDFHRFNRKTQVAFLKGLEGAVVTAYARSIPTTGFLCKIRSVSIEDNQSNDQMFVATVQARQVFESEVEDGLALGGVIRLPALPPREPEASEENADQEDQPKGTGSHKCLVVFNKKLNRIDSIAVGVGAVNPVLGGTIKIVAEEVKGVKRILSSKWFRKARTGTTVTATKRFFRKNALRILAPGVAAAIELAPLANEQRKKIIRFGECEN